jgi:hypothetical protein
MTFVPRVTKTVPVGRYFDIEKLHEKAVDHAEKMFRRHGMCLPTWLMWENNAVTYIETPWENQDEKEATVMLMRDAINNRHQVDGYAFLVEAWVAKQHKDDPNDLLPSQRPKDQRDDVLMAWTFPRDGKPITTRWLVTVRKTGPNFLGPRDDMFLVGMEEMRGLMWNLFEPEVTVQ